MFDNYHKIEHLFYHVPCTAVFPKIAWGMSNSADPV